MIYVNNTILAALANALAPHLCLSCDATGVLLCESCKYNIGSESFSRCVVCLSPAGVQNVCASCDVPYSRAWCVGEYADALQQLLSRYKFGRTKAACTVLADLLDEVIDDVPADVIITTIPTISRHIRQRGYDHIGLIGKQLARDRGLPYRELLKRRQNTTQVGSSRRDRMLQASRAFAANTRLNGETVMLVDDVFTTGSTLRYASQVLRNSGAGDVWIAFIARQTLD